MAMSNDTSGAIKATEVAPEDEAQFHLGFERLEAEIRAFPKAQTVHINLEILGTIATVLGVVSEIAPFRETMARLPDFQFAYYDKLRDYALALGHTQGLHRAASGPTDPVGEMARAASDLHETLQMNAKTLARSGLVDAARLAKLQRSGNSFKAIGFDLVSMAQLLLDSWDRIDGSTPLKREELVAARLAGNRLVTAAGVREQQPDAVNEATVLRSNAFSLLLRAYDEVERAMHYLRWHHKDAEKFTPSLYAGRGGRGRAELVLDPEDPEAPGTAPPGTSSVGTNADGVAAGATTGRAAAGGTETSGSAGIPIPPGFPGSSPYVRS